MLPRVRACVCACCWPDVTAETRKMQQQCDDAEARMQAARKAFEKTRKPLEAVVRLQREELARRKVGEGEAGREGP